ncbi:pancreatic triacylglycerol lipase-like [Ornithodoros turicata]|uniref:pancreatic triacylglycerol lipase-like n=1 Tax=Ornithodoros turicata TaxID=34597 RepID=UPI003139B9CA
MEPVRSTLQTLLLSVLLVLCRPSGRDLSVIKRSLSLFEKCMPDLGCFRNGGNWFHLLYRPVSALPDDRDVVNTTFLLYTRDNPSIHEYLVPSSHYDLLNTQFNPRRPTKLVVHGYMDNIVIGKWLFDMRDKILQAEDANVIIVDWKGGNLLPYPRATANTRVAGAEIAHLIRVLESVTGAKQESFHCIGHSLGAQICGYAGQRLARLGRISGLDPAGPFFHHMHPEVRLDPKDALFVDVIHSDASHPFMMIAGFGMDEMVGDLDFYPNNGNRQPGCQKYNFRKFVRKGGLIDGMRRFSSCDHIRALDYYLETITNEYRCLPVAVSCASWDNFVAGQCSHCDSEHAECAVMGYHSDKLRTRRRAGHKRKLFLQTNDEEPFCLHQYNVAVKMSRTPKRAVWDAFGEIYLHVKSKLNDGIVRLSRRPQDIRGGRQYNYYFTTREKMDSTKAVGLRWSNLDPEVDNRLFVHSVKIRPFDSYFKRGKHLRNTVYCANNSHALAPGEEMFLEGTTTCPDF